MTIKTMTNEEISKRINELTIILNGGISDEWDEAYNEYCQLSAIQSERYRAENQDPLDVFYNENIKGKTWDEIDPDAWQTYSDWHKDVYGYRPKSI